MLVDALPLKRFLLDSGLISQKDVEAIYQEAATTGRRLEEVLLASGKISADDLRRLKSYVLGVPFVDLRGVKIPKELIGLIPEPIARRHNIVAFKKSDRGLEVAMLDPDDLEAIDFIKKGAGLKILPRLTDVESIRSVLLQYQKSLKAEFGELIVADAAALAAGGTADTLGQADLKKLAEDLPVVRIVDTLLTHAVLQQASDIHLEPFEKELVVRYRIDGLLHDAMILPKHVAPGLVARIKVLANLRLDEKRLPQDGRFKLILNEQPVSFRVSILPTYFGEKIVLRLLPDRARGFTLDEAGFHGEALEWLHQAIKQTTGMILVTGPTGSGKTTTLYTLMDILNIPSVNISTIEDPIEYQMSRINQTQVKPEIGLTFANGLRSLVRQDPDIVMVGEIRDRETIGLAVNAALTGHLVLSTLHTNSAAGAIPRMLDLGAEPFLLVSTINVIMAQRLVRRLCAERETYKLTEMELKKLSDHVDLDQVLNQLRAERVVGPKANWPDISLYRAKPSEACPDGYQGRIGIYEVLRLTPSIKELVLKTATAAAIATAGRRQGMLTMLEDGLFKAVQGITTVEEVLRVVNE